MRVTNHQRGHRSSHWAAAWLLLLSLTLATGCGGGAASTRADEPPPAEAPVTAAGGAERAPVAATTSVDDLVAEARTALARGRYDQAERALLEATGLRPAEAEAQHLLGVLRFRTGDLTGGAAALERALAEQPDAAEPFQLLVRLRVRQGDPAAAERLIERRLADTPEDMALLAMRQWVWLHQGRAREVIEASRELLRKDETNLALMVHLARAYLQLKQIELAEYVLQTASKIRDDARVHHGLAEVAVARGERKTALYHLRKVVELEPDSTEALNNLGVLYHWAGDDAAAIEVLQKAVALAPTFAKAYVNLGNAFRRQRSFAEAEESYRRAIAIDGEMADAHYNLGILYFEQDGGGAPGEKRFQQALESFLRYKTLAGAMLSPDDPVGGYIAEARRMIAEIERGRSEEPEMMEDPSGGDADPSDGEPVDDEFTVDEPVDEPVDDEPVDTPTPDDEVIPEDGGGGEEDTP